MEKFFKVKSRKKYFALIVCLFAGLIFASSGSASSDDGRGLKTLKFNTLTAGQRTVSHTIRHNQSDDSQAARIAERLRESLKSVRTFTGKAASGPQSTSPAPGSNSVKLPQRLGGIASSTGPSAESFRSSGLKKSKKDNEPGRQLAAREDVRLWLRPVAGTPRQIKVSHSAKQKGAVLMKSMSGFASKRERDEQTSRTFLRANRALLRIIDPDDELQLIRRQKDQLGRRHLRYSQNFRGLPVWPAELNVHLDDNGDVDLMNGAFVPTPRKLVTRPVIGSEDAVWRARSHVVGGDEGTTGEPSLIIYAPGNRRSRLAWKIELKMSLSSNWLVVIDALNGNVLTAYNQVNTTQTAGSGEDLFGANRDLNLWLENDVYYMVDASKTMYDPTSDPPAINTTRGAIIISDMGNTDLPAQGGSFNYLEVKSSNAHSGWLADAVSLAYCLSETHDYYVERHNRTSIDGEGSSALGFVRLGKNYENAFWTNEYRAMFFGDAKLYAGALDVVAHELTHGITSFTCKLVYRDQSGALNEAFSDIFGEMVEARTDGSTDWINGTLLRDNGRNAKDPSSVEIGKFGYYYPSKMSEFYGRNHPLLQQLVGQDNGGVHINNTIITHAHYLLAEGLDDAIGLRDAERIFYRAQTVHLVANSQFIDARLACITSAEEIFGQGSVQVQKVAEAFDAVEVFDSEPTPVPPPTQPVSGNDSAVFIASDCFNYYLARYEEALGDPAWLTQSPVAWSRPAVTGDGSEAFYVDESNDACFIHTDGSDLMETCLGVNDTVSSVAMSPDGQVYGFVLLDEDLEPTNAITVYDLRTDDLKTYTLVAPGTEGESLNTVLHADAMDFSSDNRYIFYDAFNIFKMPDGNEIGVWSIYALDLLTEQIIPITDPVADADIGYPSLSQTTNHLLAIDVLNSTSGDSTIIAFNLITGQAAEVGTVPGDWGVPSYTGDDGAIVYTYPDNTTCTGSVLVYQPLAQDGITPSGEASLAFDTGDYGSAFGVVYRRGAFTSPQPDISVSPQSVNFGEVPVNTRQGATLTISNVGTGDLNLSAPSLVGAAASEFGLEGGCAGQTLPATGTCVVTVNFTPTSSGSKDATLSIPSNDPDTPTLSIQLNGTASGPDPKADKDGDGMPDLWEIDHNLDPNVNDAQKDPDKDGFTNLEEYRRGTDPRDPESHPPLVRAMPWLMLLLSEEEKEQQPPPTETNKEQEPNNTAATAHALGNLAIGSSITLTGRVASGGMAGEQYTGDLDYYAFVLPVQANVSFTLDWGGDADLDVVLGTQGVILDVKNGAEKPINSTGTLSAAAFTLLIGSKNEAANYQITMNAAPSAAEYTNDPSILNGRYVYENRLTDSILEWYEFNGNGGYESWMWTVPSGNYLDHRGAYSIWYPYLIMEHTSGSDQGKTEIFELEFGSESLIYLDGNKYAKS
jgi:Zn-dependent metalloprotease